MKIVFMGSPAEAAGVLNDLIESKKDIVSVVTQPDKRKGRGLKVSPSPVALVAEQYSIPLIKPQKLDEEAVKNILSFGPDLIVVVAYGKILPKKLLDTPKYGCINLHASLLPLHRGASPIQSCLLCGDKKTGVTVMQMNEKLDEGDILLQETVAIDECDDASALSKKIFEVGTKVLLQVISDLENGNSPKKTPQDHSKAAYCKVIKKSEGLVDFSKDSMSILNKIKAFSPWPGAYTFYGGKMIKIISVEISDDVPAKQEPGYVTKILKGKGFIVGTGDGSILIKEVQPENSKKMTAEEFLNGYRVKEGEKFFKE